MDLSSLRYDKLDQPSVLSVLFHPRRETTSPPPGCFDQELEVEASVSLHLRYHLPEDPAAKNILFFHGNGEVVADYDDVGQRFVETGLGFIAAEYRGYGASGGVPTVTDMIGDARRILEAVRSALKEQGRGGNLIVMGRSLGSVPAIDLAAGFPDLVDGLVIESGIAHTIPLLLTLGVDPGKAGITSEADGFRNVQKIPLVVKPTYILHAQFDEIIPPESAELLQANCGARSKEFQIVPGAGHNDIISRTGSFYFQAIAGFSRKVGMPARRPKPGVRG